MLDAHASGLEVHSVNDESKALASQIDLFSRLLFERWRYCLVLLRIASSTLNHDLARFDGVSLQILCFLLKLTND
jgi:hypothetical protein